MNLNQLYYFKTVAKLQHFTRAANELNISQPSLSYAMSSLEEELNTYLFEKQGRNVTLTKYGKLFLTHVENALEELELGKRQLQKLTSDFQGRIDIAYLYPLAPRYIPKMVRSFLDIYENRDITFTFFQGITNDLILGLKSQKYDVIFSSFVKDETDIEFIPILKQHLVIAVPLNHPLAEYDSIDLKEIEKYPLVVYNKETGLGKLTLEVFKEAGVNADIISEAENEQALYGLVAENFGISLAADIPEIKHYDIKAINVNSDLCTRSIYMGYLKNRYTSPTTKRFISYVKNSSFAI